MIFHQCNEWLVIESVSSCKSCQMNRVKHEMDFSPCGFVSMFDALFIYETHHSLSILLRTIPFWWPIKCVTHGWCVHAGPVRRDTMFSIYLVKYNWNDVIIFFFLTQFAFFFLSLRFFYNVCFHYCSAFGFISSQSNQTNQSINQSMRLNLLSRKKSIFGSLDLLCKSQRFWKGITLYHTLTL